MKSARQLNLPIYMILEGLTNGLRINLRQLLTISPSSNPTEWIVAATKLLKIQNSEQNKIENHSNCRTPIFNVPRENYQNWKPDILGQIGQLRVEPQIIILKSDLPVHLRPYRTSPIQDKAIKGQVEELLQAGYPLNILLKKDAKFNWTDECQNAFEKLKESLITKSILHLYDPDLTCHVFVDASQKSVGAVLKQPDASNMLHPIAYHSRTLRDYEKNYAITELECLAIKDALDKFYYYLYDQKFIILTDHAALVWLKNIKNLRGRLFRWSLKLNMYDYDIKYLKGSTNIEADILARHPVAHHLQHSNHLLDINEVKTHQKNDNLCGPKYHVISKM
ncbi:retrovirus-related Pol polyprotein from transposon 297 [Trichonephila clavipes]|nr:retrovirus-related Pol polyprotein from transposon 297 [Trichonephila clavipes]